MRDVISSTMCHLARSYPDFGRRTRIGERRFQEAFHEALQRSGAAAERERRYDCELFLNSGSISIDHVFEDRSRRRRTAVELKYVPCQGPGHVPADRQAFPYDVIKDCAKIEFLVDAGFVDDGAVVGLTDYGLYWTHTALPDWWSRRYLFGRGDGGWHAIGGPEIFETVRTGRRDSALPAIFAHSRYHVMLRHRWEYCWSDYSGGFRYVTFRRCGQQGPRPCSAVEARRDNDGTLRLCTVPFRDAEEKLAALRARFRFLEQYHRSKPSETTRKLLAALPRQIDSLAKRLER